MTEDFNELMDLAKLISHSFMFAVIFSTTPNTLNHRLLTPPK